MVEYYHRMMMECITSSSMIHMDYTADDGDMEKSAIHIVNILRPTWTQQDIRFMNFTDGITNKLIGCYHKSDVKKEDAIVVRVHGANTDLITDRGKQLKILQVLHKAGCAAPVYARFNNGITYAYIPGTCLKENVRKPKVYKCVARRMAAMHHVDPERYGLQDEVGKPVMLEKAAGKFDKARHYITLLPISLPDTAKNERLHRDFPTKEELETELDRMETELTALGSPIVLCHNDLLLNNIIYNEEKGIASFIDFEYSGYNYEASDIGCHFTEWAGLENMDASLYPSRDEQLPWLRCYLEEKAQLSGQKVQVTDKDVERLYVQMTYFSLGLWGLVQAGISTIDFDYLWYAKQKFDEYFKRREEFLALQMPA